jgi:putative flippase GtrA
MSLVSPKITAAGWRMVPGPLRRKLRSQGGRRLVRFAPAAILALCATQLTYFILQVLHVSAGIAGAAGWLAGATVSYMVTRWAWERKGKPHLLKETAPFLAISLCAGIVLTSTSKFAHHEARVLGLHGFDEILFAQGLYLAANCVTFVTRFLIFHYVLFADRGSKAGEASESAPLTPSGPTAGPAPYAMASSGNGSAPASGSAPANGSGPSEDTGPIGGPSAADPRARR